MSACRKQESQKVIHTTFISLKKHPIIIVDNEQKEAKAPLTEDFWVRNDVLTIAQKLIGCELYSFIEGKETGGIIVETEAYRGDDDKASHAYNGKRTPRTEIMYQSPGRAYIYLCYGIHHLLNFVCGPENTADAVLIRAIKPTIGIDIMAQRRNLSPGNINLTNGPGKLSQALGIHRKFSGIRITQGNSPLKCSILNNKSDFKIDTSKRIGIAYAEECKDWLWRFTMRGSKFISK